MWKDNDDKIMDILENIETLNRQDFPVVCPICGGKEGHLYFCKNVEGDEKGGMWRGAAHAAILRILCIDYPNGGKI